MPLLSSSKGEGNFEPLPAGTYVARCVTVVDLNKQSSNWGDKHKIYLGFEVPSERVTWKKDGQEHEGPAMIGSRFTNSLSPKAILRQQLESWRGRAFTEQELAGFDLFNLLDKPCMISVTHSEKGGNTYANISGIMGLVAGTTAPDRETDIIKYSDQAPSESVPFGSLPEWMQKLIVEGRQESSASTDIPPQPESEPDGFDDDIPF